MSWRDQAACTDLPGDIFFPPTFKEDRLAPESKYYELGKMVCATCPVRGYCTDEGVNEEYGLWGGFTPKERAGKRVPKHPTKILPPDKHFLLGRMGDKVDPVVMKVTLRPHLVKR